MLQTNTFQGIIITDTIHSYYIFSFTCGEIEWSGQGFETAIVGYNSNADYFDNHPANGFPDIGQIISCTRHVIPQGKRRKRQAPGGGAPANLIPANPDVQAAVAECNQLAQFDQQNIPDINNVRGAVGTVLPINIMDPNLLPHCPPTRPQAEISPEFREFTDVTRDCFQSKKSFIPSFITNPSLQRPYEFISVCCYSPDG